MFNRENFAPQNISGSTVSVRSWFRLARTTPLGKTNSVPELNRMHKNVQYRVDYSEHVVKFISPGVQAAPSCWNVAHTVATAGATCSE